LLTDITQSIRYSSNVFLLIGSFLVFMWAMSRVLNVLNQGINELYNPHWDQNFIIKRAMSLFYTFLLMVVVVIIAITMIFGEMIIKMIAPIFNISQKYIDLYNTLKWPLVLIMLGGALFFIYFFMPNKKLRIRDALPGTLFTATGWILLSQVFRIYLKYFGKNWESYGTIGAVIVFLLWLNALGEMIITGGIINGTVLEMKKSNSRVF
ncbi:MAG: YihY/virulence factor BrkB family protein, partial [Lactobacillaceae bacterium]